ncbi:MAG: ATP-binding protein [Candidatus Sumerlaeia bacterium]|nr:ATP-binding protein [Candidatus Sumerlaeia bacterium]
MTKLHVEVKQDHIQKLTSSDPVRAIGELVWNALDADASRVDVEFEIDYAGGIEEVRVIDNGSGMTIDDARSGFSSLGGSWKGHSTYTKQGRRILHGKEGKGRFKAFALGSPVEWTTRFQSNGQVKSFRILGELPHLHEFDLSDPAPADIDKTGTEVRILNVAEGRSDLTGESARQKLIQLLAPYLAKYPGIDIFYGGTRLDLAEVTEEYEPLDLEPVTLDGGTTIEAELSVRIWTFPNDRKIALCDAKGFTLAEATSGRGVRAPGFNFTAYLASDYFVGFHEAGTLQVSEMFSEDEGIWKLIGAARKRLSGYFRERLAARTAGLVDEWRAQKIYPFKDEPADDVEKAERQVFDIMALNVNRYLPDFDEMEVEAKGLIFECLRVAIDSGEETTRRLLSKITKIPKKTQEDLLELIEKTDLISVIEATKEVSSRLEFLAGLRTILFEPEVRDKTKERSQLHRLLAKNIWVFGEHFNLTVDDQSLTEVLKRHEELLGREPSGKEINRADGRRGIVDLMLSGLVSPSDLERREHLVVELKRPSVKLKKAEYDQILDYALAVVKDPAFAGTETTWHFWLIGDEVDEYVERRRTEANRPKGAIYMADSPKVVVWAKNWGEIIHGCETRLRFFKDRLKYSPTKEQGMAHLSKEYAKYVPQVVHDLAGNDAGLEDVSGSGDIGDNEEPVEPKAP